MVFTTRDLANAILTTLAGIIMFLSLHVILGDQIEQNPVVFLVGALILFLFAGKISDLFKNRVI